MTKQEYLNELQKNAEESTVFRSQKGIKKRKRYFKVLAIGTVLALGGAFVETNNERKDAYSEYIESGNVSFEYLDYQDTFEIWNSQELGNDVNTLLSGGKVLVKDDITITPNEKNKGLFLKNGFTQNQISESNASYINLVDRVVYYRNDKDRNIYLFDLNTQESKLLYDGNVGEIFFTNNKLYYIDFDKNSCIVSIDLADNLEKEVVVDYPTHSFVVCGDTVVFLGTDKTLYTKGIGSDSKSSLINNIERFFLNGKVVAESGNTIFQFLPTGGRASEVYNSESDSVQLVGVGKNGVYIQENSKLYCILDSKKTLIETKEAALFKSIVEGIDGKIYTLAYFNNEGVEDTVELINSFVKEG